MILVLTAAIVVIGVFVFTFGVRAQDLPADETESPAAYLEERKATIYENLRDLQFEYRLGKLSDADYDAAKTGLEKELAVVLAEIDRLTGAKPPAAAPAQPGRAPKEAPVQCASCGAKFPMPMKFCGECGAPMAVEAR